MSMPHLRHFILKQRCQFCCSEKRWFNDMQKRLLSISLRKPFTSSTLGRLSFSAAISSIRLQGRSRLWDKQAIQLTLHPSGHRITHCLELFQRCHQRTCSVTPSKPHPLRWGCAPGLSIPLVPQTRRRMLRHNAIDAWKHMQKTGWQRCSPPVR